MRPGLGYLFIVPCCVSVLTFLVIPLMHQDTRNFQGVSNTYGSPAENEWARDSLPIPLYTISGLMYMCTLHVVTFWHDKVQWFNSCSKENINRHKYFYDRAYCTVHSKCNVWNAVTFEILIQIRCIRCRSAYIFCSCRG